MRDSASGLSRCIGPVLARSLNFRRRQGPVHVLLAVCDHFEPQCGRPPRDQADARAAAWAERYPTLFGRFRDSDGRPPRHSFFFPIDEYDARHVEQVMSLCRRGYGELEVHHHHDRDTSDAMRDRLLHFKHLLHERHGALPRDRRTGELRYGFIHGNWALCNSRPDGRHCGVNDELDVLRTTGCYADFTMPSVPSPTQSRKVNSIYYARARPGRSRSHDSGVDVGSMPPSAGSLMLMQGPLLLDWSGRPGIRRVLPRIENGNLQGSQPPTMRRLRLWLRASVQVRSRPDWYFVKLHTHGATETNQRVVLDTPMQQFHDALAAQTQSDPLFHFHYVTAREFYNLARAAEAGYAGPVNGARDFELIWNPQHSRGN